jgi:hypothetical protein
MRQKSWASLIFKVRHLSLEVEDRTELIKEHVANFERLVLQKMGEPPPENQAEVSAASGESTLVLLVKSEPIAAAREAEVAQASDHTIPEAVRKLWKAIAKASHPDRVGADGDLGKLYRVAAAAWAERDFAGLVGVAVDLGLAIEPDEALGAALRRVVSDHERRLAEIDQMAVWCWIQAEDEERDGIVIRTSEIVAARRGVQADKT